MRLDIMDWEFVNKNFFFVSNIIWHFWDKVNFSQKGIKIDPRVVFTKPLMICVQPFLKWGCIKYERITKNTMITFVIRRSYQNNNLEKFVSCIVDTSSVWHSQNKLETTYDQYFCRSTIFHQRSYHFRWSFYT